MQRDISFKAKQKCQKFLQFRNKHKTIPEEYPVFNGSDKTVEEDPADYRIAPGNIIFSTLEDVRKNEFNLVVKRYFLNDLIPLVNEKGPGRLVGLETILKPYRVITMNSGATGIPYLSISNLNNNITKFTFDNNFDEADESETPVRFKNQTWEQIKKEISKTVSDYLR